MEIASNSIDPDGAGGALSTLGKRIGIQRKSRSFGEIQVLGENRVAEELTWSLSE